MLIPRGAVQPAGFLLGSQHVLFIPAGLALSVCFTSAGFVLQTLGLKVCRLPAACLSGGAGVQTSPYPLDGNVP